MTTRNFLVRSEAVYTTANYRVTPLAPYFYYSSYGLGDPIQRRHLEVSKETPFAIFNITFGNQHLFFSSSINSRLSDSINDLMTIFFVHFLHSSSWWLWFFWCWTNFVLFISSAGHLEHLKENSWWALQCLHLAMLTESHCRCPSDSERSVGC